MNINVGVIISEAKRTQNLQPEQKTGRFIQQDDQQSPPIKIDLEWTTSQTMQHFFLGIRNSYRLISSSVTSSKIKYREMTLQPRNQTPTLSSIKL